MPCQTAFRPLVFIAILSLSEIATAQLWLEPRCKPLPLTRATPLVQLRDGRLLTLEKKNGVVTSSDDGKTWSPPQTIYDGPAPGIPGAESGEYCALLKTRSGAIVLLYMDMSTYKWDWDVAKNRASDDTRLDVWAIRSLDEGKTWIDRQKVLDGYCGALIGMIQTSKGRIIAPMPTLLEHTRHASLTCVSDDDGKTWRQGNIIDLGGRGDHDGAIEPTVVELSTGRILMLLRTNLDRFWEAYSDDGRYWRELRPSSIDASSAPGYLARLASGRLALVWNRLYPEGKNATNRRGGGTVCETQASWQREELSLAFSQDDAKTWTKPVVIARQAGAGLSYPMIFERKPGDLWIITRFNDRIALSLREADFVEK